MSPSLIRVCSPWPPNQNFWANATRALGVSDISPFPSSGAGAAPSNPFDYADGERLGERYSHSPLLMALLAFSPASFAPSSLHCCLSLLLLLLLYVYCGISPLDHALQKFGNEMKERTYLPMERSLRMVRCISSLPPRPQTYYEPRLYQCGGAGGDCRVAQWSFTNETWTQNHCYCLLPT